MQKYEKTIIYKEPFIKSGHLQYGQGTAAKPQVDNDKIYFGRRLKKLYRQKAGHRKRQSRKGLASFVSALASKIANTLLKLLVRDEKITM